MEAGKGVEMILLTLCAFFTWYVNAQEYFRMGANTNVAEATQFLREYDREASGMCYRVTMSQWRFVTNITEYNRRRMMEELALSAKFERLSWRKAAAYDGSRMSDPQGRRQLMKVVQGSRAALPEEKFSEIQQVISEMKEIYNSAKICPYGQKPYEPHVQRRQMLRPYYATSTASYQENFDPSRSQNSMPHEVFQSGNSGNPGYPGSSGNLGNPVNPGYNGNPGNPGYSGNPGSPENLGSLRNPGNPGYPGNPGNTGYPGNPGNTGYPGNPGNTGYPGNPGNTGYPGNSGNTGYPVNPGNPGNPGYLGNPGNPGYPMSPGNPGNLGNPGNPGNPGYSWNPENPVYPGYPVSPGYPENQGHPQEHQPFQNYCDMQLDPEISRILAHSRIESELLYVWKSFREQTGPKLKNRFMRYVQLANQAAVATGFIDAGDQMRSTYEDLSFRASVEEIYNQIAPLYKQLFAYVRKKLVQRYSGSLRPDGPIPAHLLGNMWAQNWKSIMDLVIPFPQAPTIDVTTEMLRQGFTPLRMFQMAEEFYTSMGLKPAPPEFWRASMLVRPTDRNVQCTASAWDFCNRIDYRIKQCTEVTMQDLISTHHEMAHIQYYLQYSEQPQLFRDGANPAFHEAMANAATLSVYNIPHLQRVGLYNNRSHDPYQVSMNFLMSMALEKVAYLPFAFMVDQWRWSIFEDGVQNMNSKWWQMKLRYQGVIPPIPRTEADFDPGSKYHIISDQEYIKYFLATVLEFQIFEQLCWAAGHKGHLHECDVYRSRDAGRLMSELMQAGSSKTASELIKTITRGKTNRISPESLVRYFRPLELWLRVQNRDEPLIGWNSNYHDYGLFSPQRGSGSRIQMSLVVLCTSLLSSSYVLLL